jgi:predicted regulator of Ras-like GTPase activity (Roadblock/LC7/MglB family)
MLKLENILKEMADEIPGFIATSIVGMDGLGLANYSIGDFDYETANAQFALVMKLLLKTVNQMGKSSFEDYLVANENSYLMTFFIGDVTYWVGIAVDRKKGTLGNMRLIARNYREVIWQNIPKRGR